MSTSMSECLFGPWMVALSSPTDGHVIVYLLPHFVALRILEQSLEH